ncbi:hypothetical protein [Rhodophyticola sp.]|jgi:hypothetical protein|uniref:hypothetical protein n=1 Tax=Rhodophyticola sp. TaxID=2680032 RepID=UPI003D298B0F
MTDRAADVSRADPNDVTGLLQQGPVAAAMHDPQTIRSADLQPWLHGPGRMAEAATHSRDDLRRHGRHVACILRGGQYVIEPYSNEMVLELQDGIWRSTKLRAHVDNVTCTVISLGQLREIWKTSTEQS